jgi:hypothetical protein
MGHDVVMGMEKLVRAVRKHRPEAIAARESMTLRA